jgi:hypothetical protein
MDGVSLSHLVDIYRACLREEAGADAFREVLRTTLRPLRSAPTAAAAAAAAHVVRR